MKIRTGFVSNSSSSSYICDICGDIAENEEDLVACQHGHAFCEYHLTSPLFSKETVIAYIAHTSVLTDVSKHELISLIRSVDSVTFGRLGGSLYSESDHPILHKIDVLLDSVNYNIERWEIKSDLPPECCPICTFEVITDYDLINYFTASTRMSRNDVIAAVKRRFKDYETFQNYLIKNKLR